LSLELYILLLRKIFILKQIYLFLRGLSLELYILLLRKNIYT
jgi:hypothetical protein